MKTRLFTVILLMVSLVTFAQTSRRNQSERRGQERSNNKSENQNERKRDSRAQINSSKSENSRGYSNNSNERRENQRSGFASSVNRIPERRDKDNNREIYRHDSPREYRSDYHSHNSFRRPVLDIHYRHHVEPLEIRRARFPFRAPLRAEIIWSSSMYNDFRIYYPEVSYWRYPIGHRIVIASAYDSRTYIGEVANIYGRVAETYYNRETDEYSLYLGDNFPYHDFSVVIPGYEARLFSETPEYYFANTNISVTGYVSNFEGKPEIQVHRASQIAVY